MSRIFFLLLFLFICAPALAYIPDYHLILSKTSDNHGRGAYLIEQDLVFRGDPDPLVVKETWIISGENSMRVAFEGKGILQGRIQGAFVYDHSTRRWVDEGGTARSTQVSGDWAEPFFHFRYSKNIKPKLVALKIAPPDSLRDRLPAVEDGNWTYPQQTFMRLSRTGGTVNYAIGTPTPAESVDALPGLWIEQDQFVVRKLRLPSQALITANEYSVHSSNFWLPRVRTYSWGVESVQVFVSSVKGLGSSGKFQELLRASSLDPEKHPNALMKMPEFASIKDFYARFR